MASKRSPALMTRLVAQWRESGDSRASFARRHGALAWTFWYWCRKLSGGPPVGPPDTPSVTFVPVGVAAEPDAQVLEVVLTSGERLHVCAGAPADLVRVVLTVL